MRVVVVTTSFKGGGAEFVALTWASWLASSGHDVRLATTTIHDDGVAPAGVRHVRLASGSTRSTVLSLRSLLEEPADVMLALQSFPNLVALAATRGRADRPAVVISERNITTREGEKTRASERLKRAIALRWYRRADLAIAVSHAVAAELVSAYRVPGGRVVVVPNPSGWRAETRGTRAMDASADGALRIALPMRLVAQKRVGLAVEAAALLRARGVDARLLCFSTAAGMAALSDAAGVAGVPIESPGWVSDWAAATPPGSVAVLPSYREGFGNVLVEAAAAGIPSVAISNAFGVADALIPGVSGRLAFTGTPTDVADAILAARDMDMTRVADWTRRFSTEESGRLLVAALSRAIARRDRMPQKEIA
jgi:glycosyltransferase involved in cell wall biosynthesis